MASKTHDYTNRYWGHDYMITAIIDHGQQIKATGWGRGMKVGDTIILKNEKSRSGESPYRITKIKYQKDPSDMWMLEGVFEPREE